MIRRRGPSPDARRGSALAGPARRARGGALALTVLLSTCLAADREAKVALPPALDVEFSGCGAVLQEGAGIACELPEEGALRLWIKADEDAKTAIAIDGQPLAVTGAPEEVQGGTRHRVEVAPSARALSVVATRGGAQALFRLDLRPPEPAPAAVTEAEALRKKGKLAEAAALLAAPARDPAPRVRAAAIGTLARIALDEGKKGRADEAIAKLGEAAAIHREAGRISDALRDELARAFALLYSRWDFAEARRALERSRSLGVYAEARVRTLYYEGVIADRAGDVRAVLRHLRASAEGSERLGLDSYRAAALPLEAHALLALGRERDGAALVREAEDLADRLESACERANLLTNAGWFALHARGDDRARAAQLLESAHALYGEACPKPADRTLAATNLARLALARGDPGAARRWVDEARREQPEPDDARVTATWREIEGRLALEAGDPDAALRAYDGLAQLAAAALLPTARWRAALGRARALEARGRDAEAAEAYAQAEALVEDHSLLVPAHEGREEFLGELDESARRRVAFLLRRAPAEAAAAARRARARALATLQWIDRLGTLGPAERAGWEAAVAAYRDEREELEAEAAGAWKLSEVELAAAIARREERERRLAAGLDEALAALG
ncbi:MAG: hypothetical protein IT372_13785, partial [Polyangiaceae bacterium]|nr:hypothetical protein [Polyangiaceae bacterium]